MGRLWPRCNPMLPLAAEMPEKQMAQLVGYRGELGRRIGVLVDAHLEKRIFLLGGGPADQADVSGVLIARVIFEHLDVFLDQPFPE